MQMSLTKKGDSPLFHYRERRTLSLRGVERRGNLIKIKNNKWEVIHE